MKATIGITFLRTNTFKSNYKDLDTRYYANVNTSNEMHCIIRFCAQLEIIRASYRRRRAFQYGHRAVTNSIYLGFYSWLATARGSIFFWTKTSLVVSGDISTAINFKVSALTCLGHVLQVKKIMPKNKFIDLYIYKEHTGTLTVNHVKNTEPIGKGLRAIGCGVLQYVDSGNRVHSFWIASNAICFF